MDSWNTSPQKRPNLHTEHSMKRPNQNDQPPFNQYMNSVYSGPHQPFDMNPIIPTPPLYGPQGPLSLTAAHTVTPITTSHSTDTPPLTFRNSGTKESKEDRIKHSRAGMLDRQTGTLNPPYPGRGTTHPPIHCPRHEYGEFAGYRVAKTEPNALSAGSGSAVNAGMSRGYDLNKL